MQTNPAVEQNKNIECSECLRDQSSQRGKCLLGKYLPKSQDLSSDGRLNE